MDGSIRDCCHPYRLYVSNVTAWLTIHTWGWEEAATGWREWVSSIFGYCAFGSRPYVSVFLQMMWIWLNKYQSRISFIVIFLQHRVKRPNQCGRNTTLTSFDVFDHFTIWVNFNIIFRLHYDSSIFFLAWLRFISIMSISITIDSSSIEMCFCSCMRSNIMW